jgi:hypothetical protein
MMATGSPQKYREILVTAAIGAALGLALAWSLYDIINNEYIYYAKEPVLLLLLYVSYKYIRSVINHSLMTYLSDHGINILLVAISLVVCLFGLELYLAYVYHDSSPIPTFVTQEYRQQNDAINRANLARARKHPDGFNDAVRREEKEPGIYRVAVLGDSFIWGDGVTYEQIWSHKLEQLLAAAYPGRVEVISWGLRGWSTLDEFHFLKARGLTFHPDLLIIGYVPNDPDLGNYRQRYFRLNTVLLMQPLRRLFPDAVNFLGEELEAQLSRWVDLGYGNWEAKLYNPENLARYGQLLREVADFCRKNRLPLLMVHTPPNCDAGYQDRFSKIAPLLEAAGIRYLDTYPAMVRDLGHYPPLQLQANPANGHPGPLVTAVYAREVFAYLKKNNLAH